MKLSLRARILKYLKKHKGIWINGGEIERLALNVGYKSSNASRRCRELHEDGLINRKEIDGKVWYMCDEFETKTVSKVVIEDGRAIEKLYTVRV
jgi:predicted transcriptional regulator